MIRRCNYASPSGLIVQASADRINQAVGIDPHAQSLSGPEVHQPDRAYFDGFTSARIETCPGWTNPR